MRRNIVVPERAAPSTKKGVLSHPFVITPEVPFGENVPGGPEVRGRIRIRRTQVASDLETMQRAGYSLNGQ
jgi:hypothetical protein